MKYMFYIFKQFEWAFLHTNSKGTKESWWTGSSLRCRTTWEGEEKLRCMIHYVSFVFCIPRFTVIDGRKKKDILAALWIKRKLICAGLFMLYPLWHFAFPCFGRASS